MVTVMDLEAWQAGFEDMFARVAGRFGRVEPRVQLDQESAPEMLDHLTAATGSLHDIAYNF